MHPGCSKAAGVLADDQFVRATVVRPVNGYKEKRIMRMRRMIADR